MKIPTTPELNEIAYARYQERKRIISLAKAILLKFPKQFSNRKRNRIASQLCSILYKEIEDRFGLF